MSIRAELCLNFLYCNTQPFLRPNIEYVPPSDLESRGVHSFEWPCTNVLNVVASIRLARVYADNTIGLSCATHLHSISISTDITVRLWPQRRKLGGI
jgi:hypothetical protein